MMEKTLAVLRELILPFLKEQPGLIHIALVPDRPNERLVVISLWKSALDAGALEKNCAYFRVLGALDTCLLAKPNPPGKPLDSMRPISTKILLN
jgi:hypothetical protein